MNTRFRPNAAPVRRHNISEEDRKELINTRAVKGDRVKIFGHQGSFIVDDAGMKLLRVHEEGNENKKLSVFRRDCVKDNG